MFFFNRINRIFNSSAGESALSRINKFWPHKMTLEILLVYFILISSLVLFFTGWIRMDIVALLVLSILGITGLVTPAEALAGFSNPAVVTVWAMFIISAALYQTGVARIIGRQVIYLSGNSEMRMIFTIMLISGMLSAIMNNTGVAALMLPVVMDVARSTGRAPSRLLMPLAFGILLGGLTTMIGTPPNLLASFALQEAGLEPFGLFDYTPVGFAVLIAGVIFIALLGRHLLPRRDIIREEDPEQKGLPISYALKERTFLLRVREGWPLEGKTLAQSRLRAALGISILSIKRRPGGTILNPGPNTIIRPNDILMVQGRIEVINLLGKWKFGLADPVESWEESLLQKLEFFEAPLASSSPLIGKTLNDPALSALAARVMAVVQGEKVKSDKFHSLVLAQGDILLLYGSKESLGELQDSGFIRDLQPVSPLRLNETYRLQESLMVAEVTEDTPLFEAGISGSQLPEITGLFILGIQGETLEIPKPGIKLQAGQQLLMRGNNRDLPVLQGLQFLELLEDSQDAPQSLESGDLQMAEAVLAPRSMLAGKTLTEINFRKKFDVTVLAIWREGRVYRTNLQQIPLQFGEAFLLYGKRSKLELIGNEPDFILLTDTMKKTLRTHKAFTSILIVLGVLLPVILGLFPLAIMVVIGVILMVLSGCLNMEEAYRAIDWRSVFLIAGLLPLGTAMQQTGAAALMAEGVTSILGSFGPWGIIAGLYLLTLFSTLVIPPAALIVVMSPVALQAAASYGFSPHTVMMALVMAAAPSFMSPVSQPANLMMMGPGGYKFIDYIKLGFPLALVVMAVVFLLLPIFWPL